MSTAWTLVPRGRGAGFVTMSSSEILPESPRSSALSSLRSRASVGLAALSTVLLQGPGTAARAMSLEDANTKLLNYKLPPVLFVPPGFQVIVSEFGRGNSKEPITNPILVQFCAPNLWLTKTTNVNSNGEAGTISAGDYIKGDSAFLFTAPGGVPGDKAGIDKLIQKSLSQKGDGLESFKVTKIAPGAKGVDGREYTIADISYQINTEAGFLIGRKGVVSLTSVGSQVQILVSVTTDKRYKQLEASLRDIANSYRVYKLDSGVFTQE